MSALAILLVSFAAQATERVPGWITFDVANPASLGGHRILHLEDVVGPRARRDVPGLPRPKVVLIFTADPEDCSGGPDASKRADLCGRMARLAAAKEHEGSLVVGVVLSKPETASVDRGKLLRSDYPYPVTVDEHGLIRRGLKADRPGVIVVVDSSLGGLRLTPPSRATGDARDRYIGEARSVLRRALEREKED